MLLGVGHVFEIGAQLERIIQEESPDVVCLELDERRYDTLMRTEPGQGTPDIPPGTPAAYRRLAQFQQQMAKQLGAAEVGGEMRYAARAAQSAGARIALVDDDAQAMVDRLSRQMGWLERLRFFWEFLKLRFGRKRKHDLKEEIARLEEDPESMIEELGDTFPTIKRVVIDERDDRMAQRIRDEAAHAERAIAVLGDGHIEGVAKRLADLDPVVHRLREIRRMPGEHDVDWRVKDGGRSVGFSFDQDVGDAAEDP